MLVCTFFSPSAHHGNVQTGETTAVACAWPAGMQLRRHTFMPGAACHPLLLVAERVSERVKFMLNNPPAY